jgi:hypothetical protein
MGNVNEGISVERPFPIITTGLGDDKNTFRIPNPPHTLKMNPNKNSFEISGSKLGFQNGIYHASASSAFLRKPDPALGVYTSEPWYEAINAFDGNSGTFWHPPWGGYGYNQDPYVNGMYQGGGTPDTYYTTPINALGDMPGEWIQLRLPYKLNLHAYIIKLRQDCCLERTPYHFYIVASHDGKSWDLVDEQKNASFPEPNKPQLFKLTEQSKAYNHFRIIVNQIAVENVWHLSKWILVGSNCMKIDGPCENFETYNNMSNPNFEGMTLMENENVLLGNLQNFNSTYALYAECNSDGSYNAANCSTDIMNGTALTNSYNTVITDIGNTNASIVNSSVSQEVYDASYQYIMDTYNNQIIQTRNSLDMKMKEIYMTNDSITAQNKMSYDSTILAGILWTILATCLLFFAFSRL